MLTKLLSVLRSRIWLILHRRHVRSVGRVHVSFSARINPMPSLGGHLHVQLAGGVRIRPGVLIQGSGGVQVGSRTMIGDYSVIGSNDSVSIGNDVLIAQSVSVRDTDHVISSRKTPINLQGIVTAPIVIEDDVWLGHGVVVLKGVTIGRGAVVGANAVVTQSIPAYAIAVGVPARVIKFREDH